MIQVSNGGQPPLNSTTHFIVNVIDQNDNMPSFLKRYYNIKIRETIIEDQENLSDVESDEDGMPNWMRLKIVHGNNLT